MNSNHQILGVSESATMEEIKAAFKKLALQFHPDKFTAESPDQQKEINDRFLRIHRAYQELTKDNGVERADSVPLLTTNPLEIDYLRTQFPSQSYRNIDRMARIIEIIPMDDDGIKYNKINFINHKYASLKNILQRLPYEPHAMQHLTEAELLDKFNQAKARYTDVENVCTEFTFLWQAQKPGCGNIYLFGTMHRMSPAFYIFADAINALIEKSDIVMTEVDMYYKDHDGSIDMSIYESIDAYVASRGDSLGKTLRGLETLALNMLAKRQTTNENFPDELVAKSLELREALKNPNAENQRKILEGLLTLVDSNTIQSAAFRNMLWMETILQASQVEGKSCFIAPGAAHLRGASSIPNFLHHEGYTLTPLMKVLPMSPKKMLQESIFRQHTLFNRTPTIDNQIIRMLSRIKILHRSSLNK